MTSVYCMIHHKISRGLYGIQRLMEDKVIFPVNFIMSISNGRYVIFHHNAKINFLSIVAP